MKPIEELADEYALRFFQENNVRAQIDSPLYKNLVSLLIDFYNYDVDQIYDEQNTNYYRSLGV